eukprot:TRINITY_DN17272_c0_g1_i1.p1 TRINITY_DN17272_c0_g1~~TRINITY_DN17272_c0_g1_i1.p1  ORF type:complete len:379 (-),score=77.72 TRINITY_DN17272_c0_g1_i1:117-1253(-)
MEIEKSYGIAKSFGFEMELLSPQEARLKCPLIDIRGVWGAAWIPTDGYIDPTSLTMALAKGAKKYGAKIIEGVTVTGFLKQDHKDEQIITHVLTPSGPIQCDTVVNCGGIFARDLGKLMGTDIPTTNVQHQYMVSDPIPGLPDHLPTFRDPDLLVYYKPEVRGLVMGGWESNTVSVQLPPDYGCELYSPDWERFAQHMEGAVRRTPVLETAGIKQLINGAIPISPDGEPILGRTREVQNAYVAAGFTAGIAAAGGAGQMLSEWIVHGEPSINMRPLEIHRFGPAQKSLSFLVERGIEAYGNYYKLKYPFKESQSARNIRTSPLFHVLKGKGAVFGEVFGYERPNWFSSRVGDMDEMTFGRPNWWTKVFLIWKIFSLMC